MLFSIAVYTFLVYTYIQKGEQMKQAKHVGIYLKLNEVSDKDIIDRLKQVREEGKDTKQGYIKDLIRTDIDLDCLRDSFSSGLTQVKEG